MISFAVSIAFFFSEGLDEKCPPIFLYFECVLQEYTAYRERLLKEENQLVNALGFDFMIEHPYTHVSDIGSYIMDKGEERSFSEDMSLSIQN